MAITLFGILGALGFLFSGFLLWRRAREEHFAESDVFDVYITTALWALVIGRIVAIVVRFDAFGFDPLRWVALATLPGVSGIACLVTAVLMIALAALKRKWDPWLAMDVFLPAVLLWEAFLIALSSWWVSLIYLGWVMFLLWVEREYRFWDWYKGKRGGSKSGLVASLWLVGNGLGFLLLVPALRIDPLVIFGLMVIVVGLGCIFIRSGRSLKFGIMKGKK